MNVAAFMMTKIGDITQNIRTQKLKVSLNVDETNFKKSKEYVVNKEKRTEMHFTVLTTIFVASFLYLKSLPSHPSTRLEWLLPRFPP